MVHKCFTKFERKLRALGPDPRYANRRSHYTTAEREAYDKASKAWEKENNVAGS